MDKKCKKCGKELGDSYSEVEESFELVVVYEETQRAIVLNKGDCLCEACARAATYYRRIKE